MKRIICVGNRYLGSDNAGVRVFDRLVDRILPADVELIDGGLAGLNLLGLIDGAERVVFVDAVSGFAPNGGIVVLPAKDVPPPPSVAFDHAAGIQYLFSIIPHVCEGSLPDLYIVGIEGKADDDVITEAARVSMQIAADGWHRSTVAQNRPSGGMHSHVH